MMPASQTRIFDPQALQAQRVRAARLAPQGSFCGDRIAEQICERLQDVTRSFSSVLVLGPQSAMLAKGLEKIPNKTWIDLPSGQDSLPFSDQSFDLVISFLTLHQVDQPLYTLRQIHRVLAPEGLFLAALGGAGTLPEFRSSMMEAELALVGGVALRFLPLPTLAQIGNALTEVGFKLPLVDHDLLTLLYDTPQRLVQDLRELGQGNSLAQRQKHGMRPSVRHQAFRFYAQHFGTPEGKIKATFNVLFAHGWR